MLSGSEAAEDCCSQQPNCAVVQDRGAACTSLLCWLPAGRGHGSLPVNPIQYSCKPLSSLRLAAQLVLCLTPACTQSLPEYPGLQASAPTPQAGGGQLGAVRSYLTWEKNNVERRSSSSPSLSQRNGVSKKGHSHALLVLGMALASAVWFAFPDFRVLQLHTLSSHSRNRIF